MTSARADVFGNNDLQYERLNNKDRLFNPCLAAICCSLATFNFGYALGFSAEAELAGLFNIINITSSQEIPNPGSYGFDIFAVSSFFHTCLNLREFTDYSFKSINLELFIFPFSFCLFQSLVALGALVGALLGGYLMDKFGRKPTILATAPFYSLGWLIITLSFCYNPDPLAKFPRGYNGLLEIQFFLHTVYQLLLFCAFSDLSFSNQNDLSNTYTIISQKVVIFPKKLLFSKKLLYSQKVVIFPQKVVFSQKGVILNFIEFNFLILLHYMQG